MISKDQSIVGQVAAKIAADLTAAATAAGFLNSTEAVMAEWLAMFEGVSARLDAFHGWDEQSVVAAVTQAFDARPATAEEAKVQSKTTSGVRIAGRQHGEIPDWLIKDAAKAGVTEVWDNRDKVEGTKRPHFKAVNGDTAFWPPKGR